MRGYDCPAPDEQHFHGKDDDELFHAIRRHTNQDHPGEFTDEKVRGMLKDAYDDVQHAEAQAAR